MEELEGTLYDMDGNPMPPLEATPGGSAAKTTSSSKLSTSERLAGWYDHMVMSDGGIIRMAIVLGVFLGIASVVLVVVALTGSPHAMVGSLSYAGFSHSSTSRNTVARADWTRGDSLSFDTLYAFDSVTNQLQFVPIDELSLYDPDAGTAYERVYRVQGSLTIDANTGEAVLQMETNLPEISSVILSQYELNVHGGRFARISPAILCADKECTYRDPEHVSGHYLDTMKAYSIHQDIEAITLKEWGDISPSELYIILFTKDKNGDLDAKKAGQERLVTTTRAST